MGFFYLKGGRVKKFILELVKFVKAVLYKPFQSAIVAIVFLTSFLLILNKIAPRFNLYVSVRDSIVEMGKALNIVIKKENELSLYIGHSDSGQGLREDNYQVSWVSKNESSRIWFAVMNPNEEESYTSIRIFIKFIDATRIVDGKDVEGGLWVKFKDNHFNYGVIRQLPQSTMGQTNAIDFTFPEPGTYSFKYTLLADGYKPKSGLKSIIVESSAKEKPKKLSSSSSKE